LASVIWPLLLGQGHDGIEAVTGVAVGQHLASAGTLFADPSEFCATLRKILM
jgi:hypothetical protein